jgi:phosphoglycolate phosphatase-like HAD superfamily hydrolase
MNSHLSKIADDFVQTITSLNKVGIKNILMSSLYEKYLESEVDKYAIREYFDYIEGMKDTAVGSKIDMANLYIKRNNINPNNVLVIGDLISDAELANQLGANCILIPNGHISKSRCLKTGAIVYDSIAEVEKYIHSKQNAL